MRPRKLLWNHQQKSASALSSPCKLSRQAILDLNQKLADSSYVHGFEYSDADLCLLEALGNLDIESDLEHLKRWRGHINALSIGAEVQPKKCDKSLLHKVKSEFG